MVEKIRVGVSSCLLGEKVRYDGGHQLDLFLTQTLAQFVEYVPVCPEVELGLPTPREALRLVGAGGESRLVFSKSGLEVTDQMKTWAQRRVVELEQEDLCGFVFKSRSPSSGMARVKLYDHNGVPKKEGVGLFARIFMDHFPLIPVEEEGRLHDPALRENFIECVFTFKRWRQLQAEGFSPGALVDFHTRHKLLIMAHSTELYREMGRLVSRAKELPRIELAERYLSCLMKAMRMMPTVHKHVNVMQHVLGYFKKIIDAQEKFEALELMEAYRKGLVPLIVPLTLLNHFVRKYDQSYLKHQYYLNPHPLELRLRNHV